MKLRKRKKYFLLLLSAPIFFSIMTKRPEGTSIESSYKGASALTFLYDLTYGKNGEIIKEQNILSAELDMIEQAENFILLDLFLYNDAYNKQIEIYPQTTKIITDALIAKKKQKPEMDIIFITDPINGFLWSL